ncbi:hypothetical protein CWI37_0654p0020 [Hamiltosporidium tvaerminnensis]|uniref:RRM domain-containing protein n=2 Tax=Hamiltosporidium TaxID=1176354 RepID=A0A4Q9LJ24_9MICR|nr:hypothetical protein LUQ84_000608 [Hamiltosporidium tvaerminnensis]TBU01677.1 hypothetical protein CWI37_0654p0020 [Hamiltosporidium tvaerminnensis]TBU07040.1 hypothetical protein CWI36_0337p0020 [Hamiltosporidium magnivora]TBU08464.1 hypothetical protein CWI39_0180p0020 [Hamiltosporidium magnivora]
MTQNRSTICISNFPDKVTEHQILEIFKHFGKILNVFSDINTIYITYSEYSSASCAISLNKTIIGNKKILVQFADESNINFKKNKKKIIDNHNLCSESCQNIENIHSDNKNISRYLVLNNFYDKNEPDSLIDLQNECLKYVNEICIQFENDYVVVECQNIKDAKKLFNVLHTRWYNNRRVYCKFKKSIEN